MNMQFGFGGYDPYMMMGYGNFSPGGYSGMGGYGGYGGFSSFGGGFPNYYPMFNPMALYSMGQRFYNNQFQPYEASSGAAGEGGGLGGGAEQAPVKEPIVEAAPRDDLLSMAEPEQGRIAEVAPTDGLNNPMNFQKAGRFTTAADRTNAANQILADTQGGGYKGVRKLVRQGRVKKAQRRLGRIQARNTAKEG